MAHKFSKSCKYEESKEPFWNRACATICPGIKYVVTPKGNNALQLAGIDRTFKSGLTIDTKYRDKLYPREPEKYKRQGPDIFIETMTSIERSTPGWINKPMKCDEIWYGIEPIQTVYTMDFKSLQYYYKLLHYQWAEEYGFEYAVNDEYTSKGIPVPVVELMKLIPTINIYRIL